MELKGTNKKNVFLYSTLVVFQVSAFKIFFFIHLKKRIIFLNFLQFLIFVFNILVCIFFQQKNLKFFKKKSIVSGQNNANLSRRMELKIANTYWNKKVFRSLDFFIKFVFFFNLK